MKQYVMILCIMVGCLRVYSQDSFYANGFLFEAIAGNELEIIGYDILWEGTYEIPEEVNGKRVTTLGIKAFLGYDRSRSLYIPNTIKNFQSDYGRSHCFKKMKCDTVILDADIEHIPSDMFEYCENLKYVKLPDRLLKIGDEVFDGCASLESINIPAGVREIGSSCFCGCPIKNFKLPDSLRILGAFYGSCDPICFIPGKVDSLTEWAGFHNPSIREFDVDKRNLFYCSDKGTLFDKGMKRLIRHPNNNDRKYNVPVSVERIINGAFLGNDKLRCVEIGGNIKQIALKSFSMCKNLRSIRICNTDYVFIEKHSFDSTPRLKDIYIGEKFSMNGPLGKDNHFKIHIMRGKEELRCIDATDYVNEKPAMAKYTNTLSKDSLRSHLAKIKHLPISYDGKDVSGDRYYWEAVKCGKSAMPDLIDLLTDTTEADSIKMRINELSFAVMFGIVRIQLTKVYDKVKHKYTQLGDFEDFNRESSETERCELRDRMKKWYRLYMGKLYWKHSIDKINFRHSSFEYEENVHPAGGWYICRDFDSYFH